MEMIHYKDGYKYQLARDYVCHVDIKPDKVCLSEYIELGIEGKLTIKKGYSWDGPSGPTIDSKNFMRGSLIHDSLYQLIREEFLPREAREQADIELKKACLEDGMSKLRTWYVFKCVRHFAMSAAHPDHKKIVRVAP